MARSRALLTQEEARKRISDKLSKFPYEVVEPFVYKGDRDTDVTIHCKIHDFTWTTSWHQVVYAGTYLTGGCPSCRTTYSKEVCRKAQNNIAELDGNTIFHKMVSDTLDVGEIFFNIDKFKGKIEIITWNPSTATASLMGDGNTGHYYVGDALQKYFESDAKTYNFSQLRNFYLLNYVNGPDELNIIGATSPATLFFSGANQLDYVNDVYFANNDRPFDVEYQPLYNRDFDYIKAWWVLRKTINGFSNLFPEIENYLNLTFRAISDPGIKNKLTSITSASVSDFSPIDVHSYQQTNQVEVLGTALLKKKTGVQGDNQFTLKPERESEGTRPLVLPVESGNKYATLLYVNGAWGADNKAPYKDSNGNITQRVLPYEGR